MSDSEAVFAALAEIFPAPRLLRRPVELVAYESDALTAYRGRPVAVVLPESRGEVVVAVRLCHRLGVPFVARGSGTGGSLPVEGGGRGDRAEPDTEPEAALAVVEPLQPANRSISAGYTGSQRADWHRACYTKHSRAGGEAAGEEPAEAQ